MPYKNKEIILQKQKEYYQKNKEKILQKQRVYYLENKDKIIQRHTAYTKVYNQSAHGKLINKKRKQKSRIILRQKFNNFMVGKQCIICGENRPICLDFHHRNPKEKTNCISKMVRNRIGWNKILLEMEKCDIVCKNCHAIIHTDDRGI